MFEDLKYKIGDEFVYPTHTTSKTADFSHQIQKLPHSKNKDHLTKLLTKPLTLVIGSSLERLKREIVSGIRR